MRLPRSVLFDQVQRLTRAQKQAVIGLVDVLAGPLALYIACIFVYGSLLPVPDLTRLAVLFPCIAMLSGLASLAVGLPGIKLKTYESSATEGIGVFAAVVGLGLYLLSHMPGLGFPVVGTLSFAMILFFLVTAIRLVMLRVLLWVLQTEHPQTRVLIYGAGKTGLQLAAALRSHETVTAVAFIDDDPALQHRKLAGLRILPADQIEAIVPNYAIQRVLLAMPSVSAPKQARISRKLQALGLDVQTVPSFAQLIGTEALVDNLTSVTAGRFLGRSQLEDTLPAHPETYRDQSVMVTGAGGSVGSELCRQLLAQKPKRLVLFEVSELALYTLDKELRETFDTSATEIVPVLGSVTDARVTRHVLTRHAVATVFHAAAYKHVPLVEANVIAGLANNALGTRTLADACIQAGVARCILVSTDKAVRPTNIMGATKRLAEMVVQDLAKRHLQTRFSIVRFGNVLGSSGSVIPLFKEQIARGGPVTLTHEEVTRYFMTIGEAARLVLLAGSFRDDRGTTGPDVFMLDMGQPVRIRQLAEQMIHAAGYSVRDQGNPGGDIEIKVIGLRPGEKLHEELLIGRGLLTTPHPKILRAAEESLPEREIAQALRELGNCVAQGDVDAARTLLLRLVLPVAPCVEPAPTAIAV